MFTIDDVIALRGCKPVGEIIVPSKVIQEELNEIENDELFTKHLSVKKMSEENALYDSKAFMDGLFELHKIDHLKVYHLPFNQKLKLSRVVSIHPYELPIEYVNSVSPKGEVNEFFTPSYPKILFKKIYLSKPICEVTSSTYVHEITHTQIDSINGSVQDYYNLEVISIFMELVHARMLPNNDTTQLVQKRQRLYELKVITRELEAHHQGSQKFEREHLITNSTYYNSDLKAINLYLIYLSLNTHGKSEMLKNVQKIFAGLITVEDFLTLYDISLESCSEDKVLKKYLQV